MQTQTSVQRLLPILREREQPVITIRHAEPEDAEALHHLFNEPMIVYNTGHMPFSTTAYARQHTQDSHEGQYYLVACVGDEIVGSVGLEIYQHPRLRHMAVIHKVAIGTAWQGMGIGKQLIAAIIDFADNWLNIVRLELMVFADNTPAIALYEKYGFVLEGIHRAYAFRAGHYADVYTMARVRELSVLV